MQPTLPIFIQFYDWFSVDVWKEDTFDDPLDWETIGTTLDAQNTIEFYEKQFDYIRNLGIDSVAWEYSSFLPRPPIPAMVALRNAGLRIAPFIDLELSFQAEDTARGGPGGRPEILSTGMIAPVSEILEAFLRYFTDFFENVPRDLVARDLNGDAVIFVFGYGFNDESGPEEWAWFARELVQIAERFVGSRLKFYWTTKNSRFQEHLFLHHRTHFAPFQFVLDTPQSQFSHDSVTWNFGFDNLYVKKAYGLKRVIRLDRRYIEEMTWLAHAADPSLVFIYSWNEPFEGSIVFPTKRWGDTKGQLTKHYIDRLRNERNPRLPKVCLIVDDLDEERAYKTEGWHFNILREMLLYRMRLFLPQADTVTAAEVTDELLSRYDGVVDLTIEKSEALAASISAYFGLKRMMLFDPLAHARPFSYAHLFFHGKSHLEYSGPAHISGTESDFTIREDMIPDEPFGDCAVLLVAEIENAKSVPLVVERNGSVFVNSYDNNEEVMRRAFEAFYGRPMNTSILYGEGHASQRLEVLPDDSVYRNRLLRYSVNERWSIPESIRWDVLPPDVSPEEFGFIFGLEGA